MSYMNFPWNTAYQNGESENRQQKFLKILSQNEEPVKDKISKYVIQNIAKIRKFPLQFPITINYYT